MVWINIKLDTGVVEACVKEISAKNKCYHIECNDADAGHLVALNVDKAMFQQNIHTLTIPKSALVYTSRDDACTSQELWDFKS